VGCSSAVIPVRLMSRAAHRPGQVP
jgi:hypothetical protein